MSLRRCHASVLKTRAETRNLLLISTGLILLINMHGALWFTLFYCDFRTVTEVTSYSRKLAAQGHVLHKSNSYHVVGVVFLAM